MIVIINYVLDEIEGLVYGIIYDIYNVIKNVLKVNFNLIMVKY